MSVLLAEVTWQFWALVLHVAHAAAVEACRLWIFAF
jgi:hypothetical protein